MSQKSKSSEMLSGLRTHIVRFGAFAHVFQVKDLNVRYLGAVEHEMFAKNSFANILDCLHTNLLIESRSVYIGDANAKSNDRSNDRAILLGKRSNSFPAEGLEPGKGFRIRHKCYKVDRNRLDTSLYNQFLEQKIVANNSMLVILKRSESSATNKSRVREVVYSPRQGHVIIEDDWGVNETFLISKSDNGEVVLDSLKEVDSSDRTISLNAAIGHFMICTNAPNNERLQLLFVGSQGFQAKQNRSLLSKENTIEPIILYSWSDGCYVQFTSEVFIISKEVCKPIAEIDLSKLFTSKCLTLDNIQDLLNEGCALSRGLLRIGNRKNGIVMGSVNLSAIRIHIAADGRIISLKTGPLNDNVRTLVEDTDASMRYGLGYVKRQKFQIGMVGVARQENDMIPIDITGKRHSIWLSEGSHLFIASKVRETAKIYKLRQNGHILMNANLIIFKSDVDGTHSAVICKRGEAQNIQLLSGSHFMIVGTNGNLLFTGKSGIQVYDWLKYQTSIECVKTSAKPKVKVKQVRDTTRSTTSKPIKKNSKQSLETKQSLEKKNPIISRKNVSKISKSLKSLSKKRVRVRVNEMSRRKTVRKTVKKTVKKSVKKIVRKNISKNGIRNVGAKKISKIKSKSKRHSKK